MEDAGANRLSDAIEAAPFSPSFKAAFINEVLASSRLRWGIPGVQGFFDGTNVTALETGDFLFKIDCSPVGKLMIAALRALTIGTVDEGHGDTLLPKIDITEDMIRAGAQALSDWEDGVDWYGLGAIKIFSAMLAACEGVKLGEDGRKILPNMSQFS